MSAHGDGDGDGGGFDGSDSNCDGNCVGDGGGGALPVHVLTVILVAPCQPGTVYEPIVECHVSTPTDHVLYGCRTPAVPPHS